VQRLAPLLFTLVALLLSAAMPAGAVTPLSRVVDETLAAGSNAQLPAQLSVPLGLSRHGQPTPVLQLVGQTGQLRHRFCVSISHRHEILMLTEDDASHATNAYLLSVAGKLRKAVTQTGDGLPVTIPRAHAALAFAAERDYWSSPARPRPAAH
jgi:hypothetical protein